MSLTTSVGTEMKNLSYFLPFEEIGLLKNFPFPFLAIFLLSLLVLLALVIHINFSFPILLKRGVRKMAKVKGASKVTSKFQVTIPEDVREALQVKVGDTVVFVEEGDKIFITTKVR